MMCSDDRRAQMCGIFGSFVAYLVGWDAVRICQIFPKRQVNALCRAVTAADCDARGSLAPSLPVLARTSCGTKNGDGFDVT
jgi:hypothetical protein